MITEAMAAARRRATTALKNATFSASHTGHAGSAAPHSAVASVTASTATGARLCSAGFAWCGGCCGKISASRSRCSTRRAGAGLPRCP